MKPEVERALSFWQLGIEYLHLSQSASKAIADSGNLRSMFFAGGDWAEQDRKFEEATKWSDYKLGVPVLFNLYHGMELVLKGFLVAHGKESQNHKLTALFTNVAELCKGAEFVGVIEQYLQMDKVPRIIQEFITASAANIDDWYQAYKYPESRKGAPYLHVHLKYQGEEGADMFSCIADDILTFRTLVVAYVRKVYGVE